ncbi:MAG: YfhO family protein [Chloroflexi bacterium]|nr:YfhO family protein [Chloroflexota bacterium]
MSSSRIRTWLSPAWWPTLIVLAASLVILWPAVGGGQVIFWGVPLLQFQPWHQFAKTTLLAGHLPLWNPLVGMGAPLLANAQSGLLYPPNWLLLAFPVEVGHAWLIIAHWVLAGAGMSRLARRLGLGLLAQSVAALAFALSGYVVARAGFLSVNAALGWVPWVILAGDRLSEPDARFRRTLLALALAMQILAGHWQTWWYTWLLLAAWVTARRLGGGQGARAVLRGWIDVALSTALAFALSAAQVLPTLEYLRASPRASGVDIQTALTYSFWPWRLAGLIAPDLFGNPARSLFWGYANFWEDAIYIGLLPLALSLVALIAWLRRRREVRASLPRFPFGLLVLCIPAALLLALGSNTPLFPWLYRWVPAFHLFQAPTRIMLIFVFALALLAGAGAERWGTPSPSVKRWASRAIAATLAILLAAGIAALALDTQSSFITSTVRAGLTALACAIVWRFARMRPEPAGGNAPPAHRPAPLLNLAPAAAVLLIAVDLAYAGHGLNPTTGRELYQVPNPSSAKLAAATGAHRYYIAAQDEYAVKFQRFFRFDTFNATRGWTEVRALGLPNTGMLDGLATASNFDPLLPARSVALLQAVDALPTDQQRRLWRAMDVGAVVRAGPQTPRVEALLNEPHRAWAVCRAAWARGGEESLSLVLDPGFDPAKQVILEVGAGKEGAACALPPTVTLLPGNSPDVVALEASFPQPGFLVLADTFYPGWQARVDGEVVPLLRANFSFRAVRLDRGEHHVEFVYRPLSFAAGAALSLLAWAGLAIIAAVKVVSRSKTRTS